MKGEDGELKRAGIFIRLFAHLIDFFIWFSFLSYFYVPITSEDERIGSFTLLILGISIIFEIIYKTTPGKFLLKLQTVFEKESLTRQVLRPILKYLLGIFSLIVYPFNKKRRLLHEMLTRSMVRKLPAKKRFLRGIGAFILGLYVFVTFGLGNIMWETAKQKYDFDRLYQVPDKFSIPAKQQTTNGISIWQEGFRYYLPEKIRDHPLESHFLFQSYGRKIVNENKYLGITILSGKNFHLYHQLCKENNNAPFFKFLPCGLTPQQFQEEIFYTTPGEKWLIIDPITLVKLVVKLTWKEIHTTFYENPFFIRDIRKNGFTIFWVYASLESIQMENRVADVYVDELLVAGSQHYTHFFILWKGINRDETVILKILDTLEWVPPSEKRIEIELNLARTRRSIHRAMNAFRMSDRSYESAELLYNLLLERGTDQEKRYFSRGIGGLEHRDRRYKKLIFMTHKWQDLKIREK